MKTLKEQQVTSLSELLKNVKEVNEEVAKQETKNKENAIDRAVKRLNALFKEYWTPLFDKDKEYPLWNGSISIYFGKGMGDYFKLEETPINKIVLVNSHNNTRTTYPEAIAKSYNKILYMIVTNHMYLDFSKELNFYQVLNERKIRCYIRSFDGLVNQIQRLTDYTTQREIDKNTFEINGQKVKVFPSLKFAQNYYHDLQHSNVKDYPAYENENNEASEVLFQRLMLHQDNLDKFKETISQLVKIYSDICDKLLSDSDIQQIKKQFISLCNKYGLDKDKYFVYVNNWHNYKLTFKVSERTPWHNETIEEHLKGNSDYTVLASKNKGATFDYKNLEEEVKFQAFNKLTREIADKLYKNVQTELDKIKELEIQSQIVKFGKEEFEIQASKKYSNFNITHNNCKFYCVFGQRYNFKIDSSKIYEELFKQPFDEIKKRLEASAKAIEQFLKS